MFHFAEAALIHENIVVLVYTAKVYRKHHSPCKSQTSGEKHQTKGMQIIPDYVTI